MTFAVNLATVGSNATATGTLLQSGTAVASTSGTSINFTSIPSWVKRITVMLSGVSTNGTSIPLIQIGSGSVTTTGYSGSTWTANTSNSSSTAGLLLGGTSGATYSYNGLAILTLLNSSTNAWVLSTFGGGVNLGSFVGASNNTLSGALDRVRITTVNGTDTFDAGTVNILYE